jgi:hypothetical protein
MNSFSKKHFFLTMLIGIVLFIYFMAGISHLQLTAWSWVFRIAVLLALSLALSTLITFPYEFFYNPKTETDPEQFTRFGYSLRKGALFVFYASIIFLIVTWSDSELRNSTKSLSTIIGFMALFSSIISLVISKIIIFIGFQKSKK